MSAALALTKQPGPRLNRDQRILLMMAAISLVVHAVVLLLTGNLPLGRFDPAQLADQYRLVTVQRIAADKVLDQPAGSITDDPLDDDPSDPVQLGMTLLAQDDRLDQTGLTDEVTAVALRQLPEDRIQDLIGQMIVTVPKVDLPGTLPGGGQRIDIQVRYAKRSGGTGARGAVSVTARDAARHALAAQAALVAEPDALPAPAHHTRLAVMEQRLGARSVLDAPIKRLAIDLMAIAELDAAKFERPKHLDDDFEYVLTSYVPGPRTGLFGLGRNDDPRGYFQLEIKPKRTLHKLTHMPRDVVFLIDTSGSVPQVWVDQILRGVKRALNRLNKGDRFNIVFFDEKTVIFSPDGIRPFNAKALAEAQSFLKDRKSHGYTDVNQALSRLVVRDVAVERVYDLIMISDGKPTRGLMDTRQLINLVTRDFDLTASIYCVGVGPKPNRELLEYLAYRNKGLCVFAKRPADAPNVIDQLASRLRFAIIKDVSTSIIGLEASEVFPNDLRNVHQNEVFAIYGRFDQEKSFTLRVVGRNGLIPLDFTVERDLSKALPGDAKVAKRWAFWKLHDLYSRMIREGETADIKQAINQLRRKYKLKTVYP